MGLRMGKSQGEGKPEGIHTVTRQLYQQKKNMQQLAGGATHAHEIAPTFSTLDWVVPLWMANARCTALLE